MCEVLFCLPSLAVCGFFFLSPLDCRSVRLNAATADSFMTGTFHWRTQCPVLQCPSPTKSVTSKGTNILCLCTENVTLSDFDYCIACAIT
jgi:hypothetical protein